MLLHASIDKLECYFFQFNTNFKIKNKTTSTQLTQHETYAQEKQQESTAPEPDL